VLAIAASLEVESLDELGLFSFSLTYYERALMFIVGNSFIVDITEG
jgi:hypothetical protein